MPQLGAPIGFVLANGFMLLLTSWITFNSATDAKNLEHPFLIWGWRIPFLLSIVMVAVGMYVRFKLEETPVFAKAAANNEKVKTPLVEAFKVAWYHDSGYLHHGGMLRAVLPDDRLGPLLRYRQGG